MKGFPYLLSLMLILASCQLRAQHNYLDSLKQRIEKKDVSEQDHIDILLELGDKLRNSSHQEAKGYYTEAYRLAGQINNPYRQGRAMSGVGTVFHLEGSYDTAMIYYLKADSLFALSSSQVAKESVVTNQSNIAEVELAKGNYIAAISQYLHAIRTMEQSDADNKWEVLGNLYSSLATVYSDMDQADKTLEYDLKALEASKKHGNNPELTGMTALFVVNDYLDLKDFKHARAHLTGAEVLAAQAQSPNLFYKLHLTYGRLHQKTEEFHQATDAYKKALGYARQTGNVFSEMNVLRQLGFAYRDMKDYPKSIKALEDALHIIRKLDNKRLEAETMKKLGEVFTLHQRYQEATAYYQQYIVLNDSLNESETKKRINEIENKYQAERKQDSIRVLQKDSRFQKLALRKKNNQNIGIIIGAALLLLVAFLVYRNLRNKHRLLEQHEALHAQRILELEKERQLVAMQSVIKGQETERSRLARDLHDGVGGLLSGVKLSLSTMKGNVFLSEAHAQSVNNVLVQLDRSITELRRVSHNMMPEALIKFGLKEALENYCENINLSGTLKVQLQTYGMDNRMEQSTEIVLYRIVQELLNNVVKHAEAKNVLIQLIREGDHFSLTVEDDGKGFDTKAAQKEGAGLANIKARVDYLGGMMDFRSVPGEGTSVNIEGNEVQEKR